MEVIILYFAAPYSNTCVSDYMPSNKNHSPVMEPRPTELYKSSSVGRPGGAKTGDRSPSIPRPIGNLQISPSSKHGGDKSPGSSSVGAFPMNGHQSDMEYSPSGSERYRRMSQQHVYPPQFSPTLYSNPRTMPLYMAHTPTSSVGTPPPERISYSQPVSRSTSRAENFKGALSQLQIHTSDSQLPHLQLDPGLSDQMMDVFSGNVNLASYQQNHLGLEGGMSHLLPRGQTNFLPSSRTLDTNSAYVEGSEMTLSAHELFAPPPMFADTSSRKNLVDISSSSVLGRPIEQVASDQRVYLETNLDDDLDIQVYTSICILTPSQFDLLFQKMNKNI